MEQRPATASGSCHPADCWSILTAEPMKADLFSDAELMTAFRMVMGEKEAQELVQFFREPWPQRDVFGKLISDDTLMLISLVSKDAHSRVLGFYREAGKELGADWYARRDALPEGIASGQMEVDDSPG